MPNLATNRARPSERLLAVLAGYEQCLIVMHDNPDPDAIATGWAVRCLIEGRLAKPVRLVGGGAIVRAENKHMVDLLTPPIELVSEVDLTGRTGTILVDCGLGTTNHLLTRASIQPVAIIDHHANGVDDARLPFNDIRPDVAASATIASSYLREQHVEPGPKLATAILYAIRTETCGSETHHSSLDRAIVQWLTPSADPSLLAEIANAPLEREYFADLVLSMQNTMVYEDAALCFLPRASGAEIVGEVADLLVRARGIRRVLCAAIVGDDLLLSARTEKNFDDATELLHRTLRELGGCGGHAHRAGGRIGGAGRSSQVSEDLHKELRSRWLAACGVDRQRGSHLISRREIVENL